MGSTRRTPARREVPGLRQVSQTVVYEHVFANADREVGGVLVGQIDEQGKMPLVTGAIPAIAADERRATLTFTQDSWEHVHRVIDTSFPEDQIVGWYHSHPSFGIFLSEHDLFIHRNFFSGRSQIALVVDPIRCEEGVFAWRPTTDDVDLYLQQATPDKWSARSDRGESLPPAHNRHEIVAVPVDGGIAELLRRNRVVVAAALAGFVAAFGIAWALLPSHHGKPAPTPTTHPITHPKTATTHSGATG